MLFNSLSVLFGAIGYSIFEHKLRDPGCNYNVFIAIAVIQTYAYLFVSINDLLMAVFYFYEALQLVTTRFNKHFLITWAIFGTIYIVTEICCFIISFVTVQLPRD